MKLQKIFIAATILAGIAANTSCKKDHEKVYEVPAIIQPYVDDFKAEAAARGINLVVDDLIVEFRENLESQGNEAAGLCHFGTKNSSPFVELDTTSNNWTAGANSRELLVFHELGHCLLNRQHKEDLLPNGQYASLMKAGGDILYADFSNYKRDYYLDELFHENTPTPDWVLNLPAYNDYSDSQKTDIFDEEFTNNFGGWGVGTGVSIRKIENGTYYFESTNSTMFYTAVTKNINTTRDFEIETKFKIEKGDYLASLLLWGGDDAPNLDFMFIGNNAQKASLIGTFTTQEEVGSLKNPLNDTGEYNTFTVRKVGDQYQFFINETYYEHFPFLAFNGNQIGFAVAPESAIRIEYVRAAYLD
ncbi:MAG: hypothetical protein IPL35_16680 [Sphingobacteriales bacterium]|nr:hypothetical protein [Sphingobacteriales bacterium]